MNRQSLGAWSYKKIQEIINELLEQKQENLLIQRINQKLSLELEDGYMIQEWNPDSFKESNIPFTKYNFEHTTLSF